MIRWGVIGLLLVVSMYSASAADGGDTAAINKMLERAYSLERDKPDSAFLIASEALRMCVESGYREGLAKANMRIAGAYYSKGENAKALPYARDAFSIRSELKLYSAAAGCCILLSNIYAALGRTDSVYYSLYHALRLNEMGNDSVSMASTYLSLGNVSEEYKESKKALEYYLQANRISTLIKDSAGIELSYSGLGYHFYQEGNYSEALKYFMKTDDILQRIHYPYDNAKNLNNIAACYEKLKDNKKAIYYYRQAVIACEEQGMTADLSLSLCNMGSLLVREKRPDSAIVFFTKSLSLAEDVSYLPGVAKCYEGLSEAYAAKRDFEQALLYHLQYSTISDSLLNSDKISSISEMQTKYETEKKQEQIAFLDKQTKSRARQRNAFVGGSVVLALLLMVVIWQRNKVKKEKGRSDKLLLNILPAAVAEELKEKGKVEAQLFDNVSVLFTDFKNFTAMCEHYTPEEVVADLHTCFEAFDNIMGKYKIEKIKTVGDGYIAISGLPNANPHHARDMVMAAIEIREFMAGRKKEKGDYSLGIRIGINSGKVIAGIVGVKKFAYDIWGDTVNTAARMEQASTEGKINISPTTYELVKDDFICTSRGEIEAKGKGMINMYFVENPCTHLKTLSSNS
ncbi:MAG: tetratricopeptide repeat protein [Taibaiella sp.]|nr:tetratricopeptide repeat protein [Taibaiella sp.]